MGAEVIKVESPAGDSTRRMAGASGNDSASFNAVNRGKRGIVIDLKAAGGPDVLRRLAAGADVFIENYRPGVLGRLGLDHGSLRELNPRLVYASISGYGQTGPASHKGGFDLVAQGVSGLMSVTGEPDRPPVKVGVPLTDLGAGLFAACGILAALQARERTRAGTARRHVARRRRRGAVGLGGDRALLARHRPGPLGVGASHERTLPGSALRGRLHHARGRQRPDLPASGGVAGFIPNGWTMRASRATRPASSTGRSWPGSSRR